VNKFYLYYSGSKRLSQSAAKKQPFKAVYATPFHKE